MKFVVIIALSLASLSLAAPSTQPRQDGGINPPGGTSCSSPCPIVYGLDHLIGLIVTGNGLIGDVLDDINELDGTN